MRVMSSNRTIVGLKLGMPFSVRHAVSGSNRTIVGLKPSSRNSRSSRLRAAIAPLWD